MKSIKIKNKDYIPVNERMKEFRKLYPSYSLETEVVSLTDKNICVKAIIKTEEGRVIATGLAMEEKESSFINATSYVENAETSSWGRALGNLGIGIDGSIATADEVATALLNQSPHSKEGNETYYQMVLEGINGCQTIEELDNMKDIFSQQIKYLYKQDIALYHKLQEAKDKKRGQLPHE